MRSLPHPLAGFPEMVRHETDASTAGFAWLEDQCVPVRSRNR
jgi:hypothetical protein